MFWFFFLRWEWEKVCPNFKRTVRSSKVLWWKKPIVEDNKTATTNAYWAQKYKVPIIKLKLKTNLEMVFYTVILFFRLLDDRSMAINCTNNQRNAISYSMISTLIIDNTNNNNNSPLVASALAFRTSPPFFDCCHALFFRFAVHAVTGILAPITSNLL